MDYETSRSIASVRTAASIEFDRTGVLWSRAPATIVYPSKDRSKIDDAVRKTLREEARKAKRPFIHATSDWYSASGDEGAERLVTLLTVPNLVKLRPATMGLFLAGTELDSWNARYSDEPVARWESKTNHYFRFVGETGHTIFEGWLDQVATSPTIRAALNLPPLPTEVTQLAA